MIGYFLFLLNIMTVIPLILKYYRASHSSESPQPPCPSRRDTLILILGILLAIPEFYQGASHYFIIYIGRMDIVLYIVGSVFLIAWLLPQTVLRVSIIFGLWFLSGPVISCRYLPSNKKGKRFLVLLVVLEVVVILGSIISGQTVIRELLYEPFYR